jgi:hypothetical protein
MGDDRRGNAAYHDGPLPSAGAILLVAMVDFHAASTQHSSHRYNHKVYEDLSSSVVISVVEIWLVGGYF